MTPTLSRKSLNENWIGCSVLVCAPSELMAPAKAAVNSARTIILGNPVLADMAEVGTSDVLARAQAFSSDAIAEALLHDLVVWTVTPGSMDAGNVVFGVLIVDSDGQTAARLVRELAASEPMSRVPVHFESVTVRAPAAAGPMSTPSPADAADAQLGRAVLDIITATVAEVDQEPRFSVPVASLTLLLMRGVSGPIAAPAPARMPITVAPAIPGYAALSDEVQERQPVGAWQRLLDRAQEQQRRRSATSVDAINSLSQVAEQVELLYLVNVSDVNASKPARKRRADVVQGLMKRINQEESSGGRRWYVRLFSAGQRIAPQDQLPIAKRLHRRHVNPIYNGHLDLVQCCRDLTATLQREVSSFERRGLEVYRTNVVILSGTIPIGDLETIESYRLLTQAAAIRWVLFGQNSDDLSAGFRVAGVHVGADHPDVVDEIITDISTQPDDETAPEQADSSVPQVVDLRDR